MRTLAFLALASLVPLSPLALSHAANADSCPGNPSQWCPHDYCEDEAISLAEQFYVVRPIVSDAQYLYYAPIYAESNGEKGLQRGGLDVLGNWRDECQASSHPDTFLTWGWVCKRGYPVTVEGDEWQICLVGSENVEDLVDSLRVAAVR